MKPDSETTIGSNTKDSSEVFKAISALGTSERLWSQAYMAAYSPQSDSIPSLASFWESEFGIDVRFVISPAPHRSHLAAEKTMKVLELFGTVENSTSEPEYPTNYRDNVIKVIEAVSGTLGLDDSALPWGCAAILLKVP
jgi:flavin-binding protein dodecin